MTVTADDGRKQYSGNGVAVEFNAPKVFSSDQLVVYLSTADGSVLLSEGTHYDVELIGSIQSRVRLVTAPAVGETLVIMRDIATSQTTNLTNNRAFLPEVLEDELDRMVMRIQELQVRVDRAVRLGDSVPLDGAASSLDVLTPLAPVVINATGDGFAMGDPNISGDLLLRGNLADVTGGAALVGFKQSGTGAVARTVQDKLRDVVSVKDFGAVGDGVTDDSAAFAALVAYVNSRASNRGTVVYVPDGTYLVTVAPGTFNRPCSIIGEGAANCALHFQDCDGLRWDLSLEGSFNFTNTVRGVGLYTSGTLRTGLYFKGKQTFAPHGPVLLLDSVHFDSYGYLKSQASGGKEWAVNVDLDGVDEVAIRDCYIKGHNTDGTWAGVTNSIGIRGTTCTGVRIIHTQIFCVGTGISIIGQSEGWLHHGLTMVAVKYGVIQSATVEPANNHTITGSHISCFMRAVQFDEAVGSLAHVVANNFILGNGNSSADYIGVNLGASSRSQVSNNVIYSNSVGIASDVGIKVGSAAGGGYHTVANNFFRHQSTCIKIDAAVTVENVVTGNSKEVAGNVLLSDASGKAVGVNSEGAKRSNNYGTAIIPSGATAVTVNHGLSGAADNIQVTPKGSVASGKTFWIVNDGATSFQIAVNPAPASDLSVFWAAERNTRI